MKRILARLPFLLALLLFLTSCAPDSPLPSQTAESESVAGQTSPESAQDEEIQDLAPVSDWDGTPPFDGTAYLDSEVLTPSSPSDFNNLVFLGTEQRETFDRRVDDWTYSQSHVFRANFNCSPSVDVVVNVEFERQEAEEQATRFAGILGQLPVGLRGGVKELWIHDGGFPAGGGNSSILIHSDYADIEAEFIEEIFLHEAAHTSLDPQWNGLVQESDWAAAAASDQSFVSDYSEEYPDREDIAESLGAYFVWRLAALNSDFQQTAELIERVIPARLAYFDSLGVDLGPIPLACAEG